MNLIDEILKRFGVGAPRAVHTYTIGGGWGDLIEWRRTSNEASRVVGWKRRIPLVGDVLLAPMESGKTGRYRFMKIKRPGNPIDMFFADVEFVGYEEAS